MPEGKSSLAGALLLLVMIAGGITGLMWEVFAFTRKRTFLSLSRFTWRVASWILIIVVFFGMFAGLYLIRFPETRSAIRYWSFFLAFASLAVAFLVVAVFRDWHWLRSEQFRRKVELYNQLREELKKLAEGKLPSEGEGREGH